MKRTKFGNWNLLLEFDCECGKRHAVFSTSEIKKKTRKRRKKRFKAPTVAEVNEYGKKIGFEVDGKYFCGYYESIGWVIGKACKPMRDWKAAVRYWKFSSNKRPMNADQKKISSKHKKSLQILLEGYCKITQKKAADVKLNNLIGVVEGMSSMFDSLLPSIKRKYAFQGGFDKFTKQYTLYLTENFKGMCGIREETLSVDHNPWRGFEYWLSNTYFGEKKIFKKRR